MNVKRYLKYQSELDSEQIRLGRLKDIEKRLMHEESRHTHMPGVIKNAYGLGSEMGTAENPIILGINEVKLDIARCERKIEKLKKQIEKMHPQSTSEPREMGE